MRPHLVRNYASLNEESQPKVGDRYVQCRHVVGSPAAGFRSAHILHAFECGGLLRVPVRADARASDVMGEHIQTPGDEVWFVLCDACFERHAAGNDEIEGSDGLWPDGARITYDHVKRS